MKNLHWRFLLASVTCFGTEIMLIINSYRSSWEVSISVEMCLFPSIFFFTDSQTEGPRALKMELIDLILNHCISCVPPLCNWFFGGWFYFMKAGLQFGAPGRQYIFNILLLIQREPPPSPARTDDFLKKFQNGGLFLTENLHCRLSFLLRYVFGHEKSLFKRQQNSTIVFHKFTRGRKVRGRLKTFF